MKPIFVIGIPKNLINKSRTFEEVLKDLQSSLRDYHVISYRVGEGDKLICEGFYPKDFPEVEFENFKEKVCQLLETEKDEKGRVPKMENPPPPPLKRKPRLLGEK